MNILFQHDGILPVEKYGGTERIIFWHMKELVRQGHQVFLLGHPKSRVREHQITLIPKDIKNQHDWRKQIPPEVEVIHLFYSLNQSMSANMPCPHLVTIEGNGKPNETFHINTVFISKKHAKNHHSECFVYNGIDLSEYPFDDRDQTTTKYPTHPHYWKNFLFLAKAKWKVKNLEACINACKRSKNLLHIAGGRIFSLSPYFRSYGMVNQQKKLQLMQKVSALLFPVRWHEPFGIAIIEAFSQGLPVIGTPYGSLPELIPPKVGLICTDLEQLVTILSAPPQKAFSPPEIREHVEKNFSISRMTSSYLQLYSKILDGEKLNLTPPRYLSPQSAEQLLPF